MSPPEPFGFDANAWVEVARSPASASIIATGTIRFITDLPSDGGGWRRTRPMPVLHRCTDYVRRGRQDRFENGTKGGDAAVRRARCAPGRRGPDLVGGAPDRGAVAVAAPRPARDELTTAPIAPPGLGTGHRFTV